MDGYPYVDAITVCFGLNTTELVYCAGKTAGSAYLAPNPVVEFSGTA